MTHPRIRPYADGDEAAVASAWKQSYRAASPVLSSWCTNGRRGTQAYWDWVNQYVNRMLERCTVRVACNPHGEDHLWGWLCHEGPVVHYVWVRLEYRRRGIATALLLEALGPRAQDELICSHWTKACEQIQTKIRLRYCPSAAERHMRAP